MRETTRELLQQSEQIREIRIEMEAELRAIDDEESQKRENYELNQWLNSLWDKRGSNPLSLSKVREEYAN